MLRLITTSTIDKINSYITKKLNSEKMIDPSMSSERATLDAHDKQMQENIFAHLAQKQSRNCKIRSQGIKRIDSQRISIVIVAASGESRACACVHLARGRAGAGGIVPETGDPF